MYKWGIVRIGSTIIFHLIKLWKPSSSYCVMLYFWWGCRGNSKMINLGSDRVEKDFLNPLSLQENVTELIELTGGPSGPGSPAPPRSPCAPYNTRELNLMLVAYDGVHDSYVFVAFSLSLSWMSMGNLQPLPVHEQGQMGTGGGGRERKLEATAGDARRQLGGKKRLIAQYRSANLAQKQDDEWFLIFITLCASMETTDK